MNKTELIKKVAENINITKVKAQSIINTFINTITEQLSNGNNVYLFGFGTFQTKNRSSREGRNPRTGEVIIIPKSKVVKFTASKELKEKIN